MDRIEKLRKICAILAIYSAARKIQQKNRRNAAMHKHKKYARNICCRNRLQRRGLGRDWTQGVGRRIQYEDVASFRAFYRMSPTTFHKLLEFVGPLIKKEDTTLREAIPTNTRLLLTLKFLATGEPFSSLSSYFKVSTPSIVSIVPETVQAIGQVLQKDYLKKPQTVEDWLQIANDFEKQWNFPLCLGAMYGNHIAFKGRKQDGKAYINYKGFNSIVLQALVDANYNFIHIHVGSSSTSLAMEIEKNKYNFPPDAILPGLQEELPYIVLADMTFKLTGRVINSHAQSTSPEHKIFNYRLSRARRVVGNAFGIMSARFEVLHTEIDQSAEKVKAIVFAACLLHNFLRKEEPGPTLELADHEDTANYQIKLGEWRKNYKNTPLEIPVNSCTETGVVVRNKFTKYLNNAGAVPWQNVTPPKFSF